MLYLNTKKMGLKATEEFDVGLILYATGHNFTDGTVLCNFFDDIKCLNDGKEGELE